MKYNHTEAFCIMEYHCNLCDFYESLWNSRDGVTPFIILCPKCNKGEMTHINWGNDLCVPNFKPLPGMRIFIDLTLEKHKEYMIKRANRFWNDGNLKAKEQYETLEVFIDALCKSYKPGEPDIIITPNEP